MSSTSLRNNNNNCEYKSEWVKILGCYKSGFRQPISVITHRHISFTDKLNLKSIAEMPVTDRYLLKITQETKGQKPFEN